MFKRNLGKGFVLVLSLLVVELVTINAQVTTKPIEKNIKVNIV